MLSLYIPKIKKIPDLLIYSRKVQSPRFGEITHFTMADTRTSEFAGTMYTKKVTEDLVSQYYPTLSCYDSLKIEYLRTEESGLGYGRAFINLAKIQSRKEGCNGRVHLDASRVYTPRRPPHIFYRKCGFTSIYQDRIKYIDECIRKHKQLHWSMADNLPMYLPLKKENTRKVSFYSKILSYINKLKKLSQ